MLGASRVIVERGTSIVFPAYKTLFANCELLEEKTEALAGSVVFMQTDA